MTRIVRTRFPRNVIAAFKAKDEEKLAALFDCWSYTKKRAMDTQTRRQLIAYWHPLVCPRYGQSLHAVRLGATDDERIRSDIFTSHIFGIWNSGIDTGFK
jgi:hypothetical protein